MSDPQNEPSIAASAHYKKTQDGANAVPLVIASGPQARGSSPDRRLKRREILWPYSGTVK